jgi:hypothetical protein
MGGLLSGSPAALLARLQAFFRQRRIQRVRIPLIDLRFPSKGVHDE